MVGARLGQMNDLRNTSQTRFQGVSVFLLRVEFTAQLVIQSGKSFACSCKSNTYRSDYTSLRKF